METHAVALCFTLLPWFHYNALGEWLQCKRRKILHSVLFSGYFRFVSMNAEGVLGSRTYAEGQGRRHNSKVATCKCLIDGVSFPRPVAGLWCLKVHCQEKPT